MIELKRNEFKNLMSIIFGLIIVLVFIFPLRAFFIEMFKVAFIYKPSEKESIFFLLMVMFWFFLALYMILIGIWRIGGSLVSKNGILVQSNLFGLVKKTKKLNQLLTIDKKHTRGRYIHNGFSTVKIKGYSKYKLIFEDNSKISFFDDGYNEKDLLRLNLKRMNMKL